MRERRGGAKKMERAAMKVKTWSEAQEENRSRCRQRGTKHTHTKTHHRFQRSLFCLPGSKFFTLPLLRAMK